MKRCYIVGAGEFFGNISPSESDCFIAADGGLITLLSLGIMPDIIIGDFDSLDYDALFEKLCKFEEKNSKMAPVLKKYTKITTKAECADIIKNVFENCEMITHPSEKDETDMYLAYQCGKEKGCDEFYLYGGVGGREDHTFANYCLLLKAKRDEKEVFLMGNKTKIFVIENESIDVFGTPGDTISIFAFGGDAEGVSISGMKYAAENVTLGMDFPLGVSNEFAGNGKGKISVSNGALLVMMQNVEK